MKFAGIDYGTQRVGVAISDAGGTIAFPRIVLHNDAGLIDALTTLLQKESVKCVVVGDTRSHGSKENPVTVRLTSFIAKLEGAGFRVKSMWEAWSSIEASRYAPEQKSHDDAAAAAIILQRYLDIHAPAVE